MSTAHEAVTTRIARIVAKVDKRGMRLGPRIETSELADLERQHGVSLPEGYREFLLQIGDGAPGPPCYGLTDLADAITGGDDAWLNAGDSLTDLKRPFPFTQAWVWEADEASEEGDDTHLGLGRLYLGTDGCGMNWPLIVSGQERGNIWLVTGEGITPTVPTRDFLQWFEDWLDGVRDWWADE
jgi:hypothetical protein